MSQENVEAFKRATDAINRGDVEASLKDLDPDVEFHAFMEELLGGEGPRDEPTGASHGSQGVERDPPSWVLNRN